MVVVRAEDDVIDSYQPRGKQGWRPEPHGIWYHGTTGIWQPVRLEVVPTTHVDEVTVGVVRSERSASSTSARRTTASTADGCSGRRSTRTSSTRLVQGTDAGVLDEVRSYLGYRSTGFGDGRFLLNGAPPDRGGIGYKSWVASGEVARSGLKMGVWSPADVVSPWSVSRSPRIREGSQKNRLISTS